ncbi:hypothetical protein L2747_04905 [Shewanella marinintestina]|uniref:RHS repeat-associated core domain-containing protein n=1 Tax=Shewanella marinintestina TaxID=190305 RepID=UPI00200F52AA|nr:RHS repeat-associated core domain-containing protein [Shewanella marinintestina]MCL1145356.1 hypothetical protein [Shewanella marinintestina]
MNINEYVGIRYISTTLLLILCLMMSPLEAAQTIRYQHTDMLGTPVMETDEAGNVISRSVYEPFGKRLGGEKAGIGYTGHLQDPDLGLTYMQARYYDPLIGRFYSNDPLSFRDVHSFNRYAYANNNPYKYTDPTGEAAESWLNRPSGVSIQQNQNAYSEAAAIGAAVWTAGAASVSMTASASVTALEVTALATGDSVSGVSGISRGKQVGSIIKKDGSTKASTIKAKAESVGFTPQQSSNGPLKLVDEAGTPRVTIKGGSDRAPGSAAPHVELKDSNGQRVSPSGSPVTRRSPENHTPIENDL